MYFTLKDERSRIRCVFFRGKNAALTFRPENGMTVVAGGALTVYEVAGEYQITVDELHPAGIGALHLAFEQLKKTLESEGLFREEKKLKLPYLPRVVGIVTSPTGAALRDVISVLWRRHPALDVVLAPAIVQGDSGPESVIGAIRRLNEMGSVDVMIVGRGGGSIEELWTFNDERVARAIADSNVPIISAVGHETDVTIADFVADKRAPTPSAAAELAVPETDGLKQELDARLGRIQKAVANRIVRRRETIKLLSESAVISRPFARINEKRQLLDDWMQRCETMTLNDSKRRRERFQGLAERLQSASPLSVLARGYAICESEDTGRTVVHAEDVRDGETLKVTLKKGTLRCVPIGK